MYSLRDLEDLLGQSYEQIRNRVNELSDRFEGISETGKRNKTIVTERGLTLLRQLKEYEDSGLSLETGLDKIVRDLESTEGEGEKEGTTVTETGSNTDSKNKDQTIEVLQEEIKFLREQLERKDQQIQQLLPAAKEENSLKDKSLWQVIREWLQQPAGG